MLYEVITGHGMARSFQERHADLRGIINGCDYDDWDPHTDPLIPFNYHAGDLGGKQACKQALQHRAGLEATDLPSYNFV